MEVKAVTDENNILYSNSYVHIIRHKVPTSTWEILALRPSVLMSGEQTDGKLWVGISPPVTEIQMHKALGSHTDVINIQINIVNTLKKHVDIFFKNDDKLWIKTMPKSCDQSIYFHRTES